jgi:hypothetical protein
MSEAKMQKPPVSKGLTRGKSRPHACIIGDEENMVFRGFLGRLFDPHRGDVGRLVSAFPLALQEDVRAASEVLPFENRTLRLAHGQARYVDNFVWIIA